MSMITAASWVPRGYAAQFPTKYDFDEEEFDRIAKLAKLQLDDAQDDLDEARNEAANGGGDKNGVVTTSKTNEEVDDDLREYDLEHYDDDDDDDWNEDDDEAMADGAMGGSKDAMGIFGNVKNLVYHHSDQTDPYITLNDDADSDSEREELQILPTDNLILAARVEDEVAHLEVYVYEDEADNLYVHHDVMLPAIPLAVEWIHGSIPTQDAKSQASVGNYVAVGTMDPDIELWDLDTVDCMYPHAILGAGGANPSSDPSKPGKKKKKKSKKPRDDYHTDAVLSLASNPTHRNLLASASADTTIKLWDLNSVATNSTQCAKSYGYHADKVCSLAWHPSEATALLSGSYDRSAIVADMRAQDAASARRQWRVESDVENVKWDPHDPNRFYVSTENGMLHQFDARAAPASASSDVAAPSKSLWTLQAHDAPLSAFDVNPHIPGFIATGSADKTVKLWRTDAVAGTGAGPALVATRNSDAGRIFGAAFAPDAEVAFRLAVAGSKGTLQIWDTSTNAGVRRAFAGVAGASAASENAVERVVGLGRDDDDDDDDESGSANEGDEGED